MRHRWILTYREGEKQTEREEERQRGRMAKRERERQTDRQKERKKYTEPERSIDIFTKATEICRHGFIQRQSNTNKERKIFKEAKSYIERDTKIDRGYYAECHYTECHHTECCGFGANIFMSGLILKQWEQSRQMLNHRRLHLWLNAYL